MTSEEMYKSVEDALLKEADVKQAKMFGAVALSIKGKIFAMLVKGHLVVKLPKEQVDGLVSSGKAKPFDSGNGRVMKEWASLLPPKDQSEWVTAAREAKTFVGSKS